MIKKEEFTIENGIPIPPVQRKGEWGLALALRKMDIGQSVFAVRRARSVASQMRVAEQRAADGRRYTLLTVDGGVRVWRVE